MSYANGRGKFRRIIDAALIVIALVMAVVVGALVFVPEAVRPSAVEWLNDSYEPIAACPGDEVAYELEIEIREPAILFVVPAVLRAPLGDTAQGYRIGEVFITNIPTPRTIVDRDASFIVPDLPPGEYVRVLAAGTFGANTKPAIREQPFTIRVDCD